MARGDEAAKLYRVAYEEGRKSIADQAVELSGIRTRAVSYMAFIGTATAFLVTTTLKSASSAWPFYTLAILASLLMVWALFQLGRTIWPARKFTFRIDPLEIINRYIEREVPAPSENELLRKLSKFYGNYIDNNEIQLKRVRSAFTQVVLFGGVSLFCWTITVWLFGAVGTNV